MSNWVDTLARRRAGLIRGHRGENETVEAFERREASYDQPAPVQAQAPAEAPEQAQELG